MQVQVRTAAVQPLLDVAVPALLAVLTVSQLLADPPPGDPALLTVFALGSVLPLAWRRRAPVLVTAIVMACSAGQAVTTGGVAPSFASFVAVLICLYTLGRETSGRVLALGCGVVVVGFALTTAVQARHAAFAPFEFVIPVVYFGLAGGLGAFVRQRALRLTAVEDRAALLQEELHREAALAAAEERTRIARELHDVVSHGLSLMVVQAEAAEELLARDPQAAVTPMRRVQDTGRQSLAEMRRLLGILRSADAGLPDTAPQPGLQRLPDLVAEADAAGIRVEVVTDREPVDLPPGLDLAAFRIVQEALTNIRRHAGATRAWVRLGFTPEAVTLAVTDDGHGPEASPAAGPAAGHGLIGMRERAALSCGTVTTGPGADGGFCVRAVLPLAEAADRRAVR